jgi:hypothetical protein
MAWRKSLPASSSVPSRISSSQAAAIIGTLPPFLSVSSTAARSLSFCFSERVSAA